MSTWLLVSSLIGAALVMAYRVRESTRPINVPRIVMPPLGMSTGFGMFFYPPTRIPLLWGAGAFLIGALVFSFPLVKTSQLKREGDLVMLKRSRAFLWILLGLVAVRIVLRTYVGRYVDPLQTASLFFVLAFGMILVWRVRMLFQYRQLMAAAPSSPAQQPQQAPLSPLGQSSDKRACERSLTV